MTPTPSDWIQINGPGAASLGGVGSAIAASDALGNKATFFSGFGNPIMPGVDKGARHIISQAATPSALYAFLAQPPAAGSFTFDIMLSQDGGNTWNSILNNPISMTASGPTTSNDFAPTSGFAVTNLLRLDILSTGLGPGFANGFQCVLALASITPPTFDRATMNFGLISAPPRGRDFGGYYLVVRNNQPSAIYVQVKQPPLANVTLDIQVLRPGVSTWTSIFPTGGQPVIEPTISGTLASQTFAPGLSFEPGDLLRPYILSGPSASGTGTGYSVVLDMETLQ
jgi:hypothetical protein